MGLDNLTQVLEKTELVMAQFESEFLISARLFEPSTWAGVVRLLSQPLSSGNMMQIMNRLAQGELR